MLAHQSKKLKKSQKKGVAIRDWQQGTVTIDQLVTDLRVDAASNQTAAGRPHGSTVEALKTLDLRKRKAFDAAVDTFSRFKARGRVHKGVSSVAKQCLPLYVAAQKVALHPNS